METVLSDMEIKQQSHKDDPVAKKINIFLSFHLSEATDQFTFVPNLTHKCYVKMLFVQLIL